jgi:hypothetical protein
MIDLRARRVELRSGVSAERRKTIAKDGALPRRRYDAALFASRSNC